MMIDKPSWARNGLKSPNYIYKHAYLPKLKLLVRNNKLKDDPIFRFTHQSLTAEKFIARIAALPVEEKNKSGYGLRFSDT